MIETAQWIACAEEYEAPVIQKTFSLAQPVQGEIEITGLGFFTLLLNGHRVSGDCFTPALTDYEPRDMSRWHYPLMDVTTHRIRYLRYTLTPLLRDGENVLEIRLGPGWYRQNERTCEGLMTFGKQLKALFAAQFTMADGTRILVRSDGTETYTASEITTSNLFLGEVHDARRIGAAQEARPVTVVPAPDALLEEQTCPADRVIRTLEPRLIGLHGTKKIYDAGENISGRVCFTAGGTPGAVVRLRYAEELDADGLLDFGSAGGYCKCASGQMQIQHDTFYCSAEKVTFRPEFVWHAFRYFEVEGAFDQAVVEVIHTDAPVTSRFESSSPVLNWLYDAYVRTQLDNLHGCIPSDCPHRERLGYTGDGQLTAKTAMLTLDMHGVYRKWIRDILDCQDVLGGHVQHTAPAMGGGGGPGGWGCAMVIVPDEYDRHYDDPALLAECYPHMTRWIGYLKNRSEGYLVTSEEKNGWCLGDWAALYPIRIPEAYVNTCYLLDSLYRMIRIATRLVHPEDAQAYRTYAAQVRRALIGTYLDPATGSFCGGVQGADAYAVWVRLDEDGRALRNLAAKYRALNLFDTGFLGTEILVDVLLHHGEADLAYQLLTSDEKGSYAYMQAHGATTIWEYFNGRASHNHPMFGAPVRHLFDAFLGITQEEDSVGYRKLVIAPKLPAQLMHASGTVTLPCGTVSVAWERRGNTVALTAELPGGTAAELRYGDTIELLHAGRNDILLPG